jgi:hypothetical protein
LLTYSPLICALTPLPTHTLNCKFHKGSLHLRLWP